MEKQNIIIACDNPIVTKQLRDGFVASTNAGLRLAKITNCPDKVTAENALANNQATILIIAEKIGGEFIGAKIISKWIRNNPQMQIILIVDDSRKGSSKLNRVYDSGFYNALYKSQSTLSNIFALLQRPRTAEEAFEYYDLKKPAMKAVKDVNKAFANDILQEEPAAVDINKPLFEEMDIADDVSVSEDVEQAQTVMNEENVSTTPAPEKIDSAVEPMDVIETEEDTDLVGRVEPVSEPVKDEVVGTATNDGDDVLSDPLKDTEKADDKTENKLEMEKNIQPSDAENSVEINEEPAVLLARLIAIKPDGTAVVAMQDGSAFYDEDIDKTMLMINHA